LARRGTLAKKEQQQEMSAKGTETEYVESGQCFKFEDDEIMAVGGKRSEFVRRPLVELKPCNKAKSQNIVKPTLYET